MSISNREDANKYYQLINGLVDEYVENHKIRPTKLRSYFKPNGERFQKFLKKCAGFLYPLRLIHFEVFFLRHFDSL